MRYTQTTARAIQHALGLGIDGVVGNMTTSAIKRFQQENGLYADGLAGNKTLAAMLPKIIECDNRPLDRAKFFAHLRGTLSKLNQSQVDGFNTVLDAISNMPINEQAYMLATAWHETAHTMQPIAEYGKGRKLVYGQWHTRNGKNACYSNGSRQQVYYEQDLPHFYYGRGYVQLTWLDNYVRARDVCGVDLVNNPDLAMSPEYAAKIMLHGMTYGWFTGRKNSDYITYTNADYVNARRIINGKDKADHIASLAHKFETALRKGKA